MDDFSDIEDEECELTVNFNAAAKHLETLISRKDKIEDQILLELYGLYKVATIGPCNTPRPGWYEITAKHKWDAWKSLDNTTPDEAKAKYVKIIEDLDSEWTIDSPETNTVGWVNVSSMLNTEVALSPSEKTIFDFVKENNLDKLKEHLLPGVDVNSLDESGMGLIHWSCDRGNYEILELLIKNGANVNLIGEDGQTGLHYAASCGHLNCVELLMKHGADSSIKDEDGCIAAEVASETHISDYINIF